MKKSLFTQIGLGLGLAFFAHPEVEAKTNFVLFIADDCTHSDLGCYGGVNSITPNIDKLSGEGIRFTRCFQAAPMCSPTRHNLYTGMYPTKTGAYPNHTFADEGTKSVVQYMKPQGYRVALAGKRHIAPAGIFDFEYLGGGKKLDFNLVDQFLADVAGKEDPFCLFLCSHEPHTPWNKGNPDNYNPDSVILPPFWVDTRETREDYCKYLAEVEYMDSEVGNALNLLKKHGVDEETVFIFTSEQGNSFPFAKWTCYNTGLHTGFIVRWPGMVAPGTVSDCLIDYSDVVPTFLDIANIPIPEYLDGTSMKNILLQKKCTSKKYSYAMQTTRGIFFGSDHYGIRSVTDGHYRYIINLTPEAKFQNAFTDGKNAICWQSWVEKAESDHKAKDLVHNFQYRPAAELYDDLKDPYNMKNLIDRAELAKVQKELKNALAEWMLMAGDKGQETEMEALKHQQHGGAGE